MVFRIFQNQDYINRTRKVFEGSIEIDRNRRALLHFFFVVIVGCVNRTGPFSTLIATLQSS